MTRNLFGGIPDEAINHGFSRRRPIRSVQIPTEVGKSPTDFTDIHRSLWEVLVTQISQITQIFYSSDDTKFIRRYSCGGDYSRIFAEATYSVGADTPWEWNMSHRFHRYTQIFLGTFFFSHADFADDADFLFIGWHGIYSEVSGGDDYSRIFTEATCPVGADTPWEWTKRFNRDSIKNLCISVKSVGRNNPHKEKSASSAKSAWQKTTGAYIGRKPLASGQISAKFRE